MASWSKAQLLVLGVACVAVFAAVFVTGARTPPTAFVASNDTDSGSAAAAPAPIVDSRRQTGRETRTTVTAARAPEPPASEIPAPPVDTLHAVAANPTPDDVPRLLDVVQTSSDERNRLLALSGLRRAALAGIRDPAILETLKVVAGSGDDTVAQVARSTLIQIERNRRAD